MQMHVAEPHYRGALGACCSGTATPVLLKCLDLPAWLYLLVTPDQGRLSHPLRWPPAAHCLRMWQQGQ